MQSASGRSPEEEARRDQRDADIRRRTASEADDARRRWERELGERSGEQSPSTWHTRLRELGLLIPSIVVLIALVALAVLIYRQWMVVQG